MMNSRSCQTGIPDFGSGRTARRDKKNEVDMISKLKPRLRASASAFGMFGVSMKPKRIRMRVKILPSGSRVTRSAAATRGVDSMIGEHDILLMQHLVVFEAVQRGCWRARRICGEEHGSPRDLVRLLPF